MPDSEAILKAALEFGLMILPFALTLVAVVIMLALANYLFFWRTRSFESSSRIPRQLAMLALTLAGGVALVLSLPISDTTRGQLLSLLGIVLSAAIALSSTTLIGNAMAGFMLRAVGNLRPGDFVEIDGRFGRVSERGLLHIEIQTEDRDLVTLPNLYLVSNPVKVVRSSGTIITASVSLGYDVPHERVEDLLIQATRRAGLEDPYVQIVELGDFAITYRACGFLGEVKQILSARTRLRGAMLDVLHGADIEIVSPTFMNQRIHTAEDHVTPDPKLARPWRPVRPTTAPEEIVFDKAEAAAARSELVREHKQLMKRRAELEAALEASDSANGKREIEAELSAATARTEEVEAALAETPDPEVDADA